MKKTIFVLTMVSLLLLGCQALTTTATSNVVTIEEIKLPDVEGSSNGFVVIYKELVDGVPGPVIGSSNLLSPGVHKNLVIRLDPGDIGSFIIAQLHYDSDGDKIFNSRSDKPVLIPANDDGSSTVPVHVRLATTEVVAVIEDTSSTSVSSTAEAEMIIKDYSAGGSPSLEADDDVPALK